MSSADDIEHDRGDYDWIKGVAHDPRIDPVQTVDADDDDEATEQDHEPDYDAPRPLTALENWQQNDEHNVR